MKATILFALAIATGCRAYAAPESRYSGTVRDSAGAPVAGARVTFYPGHYPGAAKVTEVKTDAAGRYEIVPKSEAFLTFSGWVNTTNSIMVQASEQKLVVIHEFVGPTNDVNLALQPGITLSGLVQDSQGRAITNAELDFRFMSGNSYTRLNQPIKTDANGAYHLPLMPQGREYHIMGVAAKGYGSGYARLETKDTRTNQCSFPTLVLKPADRKLAGRVVDGKGNPLVGAQVSFNGAGQPQDASTNSDGRGRFSFEVCDGPLKLFAHYSDPQDRTVLMTLSSGGLDVRGGDTNILIQLRDHSISGWDVPTLVTTGKVVFPAGMDARANVSFQVWRSANPFRTFFSIDVGSYRVRWQRPLGAQNSPASILLARAPAQNLVATPDLDETAGNLDVHLEPGSTLSGVLQDSAGRPLTNATVSLTLSLNGARAELEKLQCGADGSFTFKALPRECECFLVMKAPGYNPITDVQVEFDRTREPALQLPAMKLETAR